MMHMAVTTATIVQTAVIKVRKLFAALYLETDALIQQDYEWVAPCRYFLDPAEVDQTEHLE